MVFTVEKKFRTGDFLKRTGQYGYSLTNTRLPRRFLLSNDEDIIICFMYRQRNPAQLLRPSLPSQELLGALAWMPTRPRPLQDGRCGDVCLIAFTFYSPKLSIEEIMHFVFLSLFSFCFLTFSFSLRFYSLHSTLSLTFFRSVST